MRRRWLFGLLVGLLVCSGSAHAAQVVVTHWHNAWAGDPVMNYLVEMKAAFEKANPDIKIDLTSVPGEQYANKLTTTSAAGIGPDIIEWWPGPTTTFVLSGLFENLYPYLQRDGIKQSEFIPAALDSYVWGDTLWGLPNSGYPLVTAYNKAMFDNAGLVDPYDQGKNWTWESVIATGQKLVHKNGNGQTDVYPVQVVFDGMARVEVFAHQAGSGFFDRPLNPTKAMFNTSAALSAVTWLRDLVDRGLVDPVTYPQGELLATNKTAMGFQNGPQVVNGGPFQPTKGTLITQIGFAPLPKGPVHNGTFFITDGWMMNSGAKNKQATWKWLKFIAADAAHSRRFAEYTGRIPGMVRALSGYVEGLPKGALHGQVIADITVASTTRVGLVQHPKIEEINSSFVEHLWNVYTGTEAPKAALEQIQQKAEAILGKK